MRLEHLLSEPCYHMVLIPFGDYKNINILEAEIGDVCETIDDPPKQVEIIAKTRVPVKSPIADALSMFMYNMPIKRSFEVMRRNWRYDIHDDEILMVIIKEIENKEEEIDDNHPA